MTCRRALGQRDDRGQVVLEFAGLLPLVLVVILLSLQAYVAVVAYERVHNAARTAARVASTGRDGHAAGWASLPAWLVGRERAHACGDGENPGDAENPGDRDCAATRRCPSEGKPQPPGTACVTVTRNGTGVTATVRTKLPLLFPGAPLVFPIGATVEMPT